MNAKLGLIVTALILAPGLGSLPLEAQERPVVIGVNANWEQHYARSANVGWSRIDIPWSVVNPSPGVWDFAVTDSQIDYARAQGQQILGILAKPPQWIGGTIYENRPPLSTVEWAEYVRRVHQRYRTKILAYEIWNEPDSKNTNQHGIGWTRNIEEPPLYVDFVRAAAKEIWANGAGASVIGPVYKSDAGGSGVPNRKRRIFEQIQDAVYPDGHGYIFFNGYSFHNNAANDNSSSSAAYTLRDQNLLYLQTYCPFCMGSSIWVTEYGWRSNATGEAGQREKICNVNRIFTGRLAPHIGLGQWDIRRAFIYHQKEDSTSQSLFRSNGSPKPAVTQYLQLLGYPATQHPAVSTDYPSCSGTPLQEGSWDYETDGIWNALSSLRLGDPRPGLPMGFSELYSTRSPDSQSVEIGYTDERDSTISIQVYGRRGAKATVGTLSDSEITWTTTDGTQVEIIGLQRGLGLGKGTLLSIARALDSNVEAQCFIETVTGTEQDVVAAGFLPPTAPSGYIQVDSLLELTRSTSQCSEEVAADHPRTIDFVWTFEDNSGSTIRSGIYRYGNDPRDSMETARSLHWSDDQGVRYWVAVDPSSEDDAQDLLHEVGYSLGYPRAAAAQSNLSMVSAQGG